MAGDTVLIIEDDERTSSWIKVYLERSGYDTLAEKDGAAGLRTARSENPDLILLDLMLPSLDGREICRILRRDSDIPIIMLTARSAREDKLNGLDSGADDYMVKPFDPDELVRRVRAVLRRTRRTVRSVLTCGPLSLNVETGKVTLNGFDVGLSHTQISLLTVFLTHPNALLTREQLIEQAFNHFDGYDRAVDTHIQRLRKILHTKDFQPIRTVYGGGYKLECPNR